MFVKPKVDLRVCADGINTFSGQKEEEEKLFFFFFKYKSIFMYMM